MKRRYLSLIFMLLSNVFAITFVGCECPPTMYAFEEGECNFYIYNGGDLPLKTTYQLQSGGKIVYIGPTEGEIEVSPGGVEVISAKFWANGAGKDEFRFRLLPGEMGSEGCFKTIYLREPPISLTLSTKTVPAGKRSLVTARLEGKGYDVRITIEYPPGISGDKEVEIGDMSGGKEFSFAISPDPLVNGPREIVFYVSFIDETGRHTLRMPVIINVSPPWDVLIALAAICIAVAIFIFLRKKRRRSSEE